MHAVSVINISKSVSILSAYKHRLFSNKRFFLFSVKERTEVAPSPVVNPALPPTPHLLTGWKKKAYCASPQTLFLFQHFWFSNLTEPLIRHNMQAECQSQESEKHSILTCLKCSKQLQERKWTDRITSVLCVKTLLLYECEKWVHTWLIWPLEDV